MLLFDIYLLFCWLFVNIWYYALMTISNPLIITPRLMAGCNINGAFISIEYGGMTTSGRTIYRYYIDLPDGQNGFVGRDLKSGCCGGDLQSGLESLLTFLSNDADRYAYRRRCPGKGDPNEDNFPMNITAWAYQNSDEISMLALELQENKDLIVE